MPSGVLDWIVLKVAQRCNLDCTYCYVYNRGDDSWKSRPTVISPEVVQGLSKRINEQSEKYALESFTIQLHGGEPLLFGKERMQALIDSMRGSCTVRLDFVLQTNGLLLDEGWLELFDRNRVRFGVSLDGPPEVADKFRVFTNGKGSTRQLMDNIQQLRSGSPLFDKLGGSYLCVADPSVDGAELVKWFASQDINCFDLLLPDANYSNPPQGFDDAGPYRRFLLEAFEQWYSMGKSAPSIRIFEKMMMGFMGVKPDLDALGGDLKRLCVVESDGSIGVSDVARICGGDYAKDVLNVFEHPLDLRSRRYQIDEVQRPCERCRRCPYLNSCGGGYLPHRFDGKSFDNPSWYCDALYAVAERMFAALRADVPASLWKDHSDEDSQVPDHVAKAV